MSIDPHTAAAISELDRAIKKGQSSERAYRAEGRGLAAGRAIIRRGGETIDDEETYPRLLPGKPTAGIDVGLVVIGGKEVVAGNIHQGDPGAVDLGFNFIGQLYPKIDSQPSADNPSTTNKDDFVTAMTTAITLVDGTYDFWTNGSMLAGHSAASFIDFQITIGASVGGARSLIVPTTSPAICRIVYTRLRSAVAVTGGSVDIRLDYKRGDALVGETAFVRNPELTVLAVRVG